MSDKSKNLSQNVPDNIVQLATKVFGAHDKVELWLSTPINVLNGNTPITRLNTDEGIDEVIAILRKIQKGEFS